MPDYVKKVERARERLLQPEERVLGAAMIHPKGSLKKRMIGGSVGGAVGAIAATMSSRSAAAGGMAAALPSKPLIAALTGERLVVIRLGSFANGVKDVAASWARSDVVDIVSREKGRLVQVLAIAFSDGSEVEVECPRAGNADSLLSAFASTGQAQ